MRNAGVALILAFNFTSLTFAVQQDVEVQKSKKSAQYKPAVVGVEDVSRMKTQILGGFAEMQRQMLATSKIQSEKEVFKEDGSEEGPNGRTNFKLKGQGGGGGAGGGMARSVRFAGRPKLAIALKFPQDKKNQRFQIQNFVLAKDANGITYEALPTSSRPTQMVPRFEAKHDGNNTVYFTRPAPDDKRFTSITGQVRVFRQDIDEVMFDGFEPAKKKTRLGQYEIKVAEQQDGSARLVLKAPMPKSYRKDVRLDLRQRIREPKAMARYKKARLESRLAVTTQLLGSDGLWYQPNGSGNAPSQNQTTFTTSKEQFGKNSVRRSQTSSNLPPDSVEREFTRTKLPPGVKIVGVRVRVAEAPTDSKVFDFKLEDVALGPAR